MCNVYALAEVYFIQSNIFVTNNVSDYDMGISFVVSLEYIAKV